MSSSLLATEDAGLLFVAGCEEDQAAFHHRFDRIILLTAPLATLTEGLVTREANPFG